MLEHFHATMADWRHLPPDIWYMVLALVPKEALGVVRAVSRDMRAVVTAWLRGKPVPATPLSYASLSPALHQLVMGRSIPTTWRQKACEYAAQYGMLDYLVREGAENWCYGGFASVTNGAARGGQLHCLLYAMGVCDDYPTTQPWSLPSKAGRHSACARCMSGLVVARTGSNRTTGNMVRTAATEPKLR